MNWLWADLWKKELTISKISIDDIHLDIVGKGFKPELIGPINLLAFQSEANEPVELQQNNSWALNLGETHLSGVDLCYQDSELDYSSLKLPISNNSQSINICLRLDELELNTSLKLLADQSFAYTGQIELMDFKVVDGQNHNLLAIDNIVIDELAINPSTVSLKEFSVKEFQLLAQRSDDLFADNGVAFEGFELKTFNWNIITGNSSFEQLITEQLHLKQRASDGEIHNGFLVSSVIVNKFSLDDQKVKFDSLLIQQLNALENFLGLDKATTESDYLMGIGRISMENIDLVSQQLDINKLAISGLNTRLTLDVNGMAINRWLAPADVEAKEIVEDKEPFNININEISLSKSSTITFIDRLYEDVVTHEVNNLKLNINNFHFGTSNEKQSDLSYSLELKDSGSISGQGYFKTIQENIELEVSGKLSNVDLVKLTQHSEKFIGYRVDQGQLNLDYDVKIKEHIIDAKLGFFLEKFALANLQEHEKSPTNEALGIPLPLALNLLRDSDDNISLDIPLSGDANSPDFSLASIFTIVSAKAIKNAVIHYYSPLGMLSLASGIIDLATALRFDPIHFEKQSIALTSKAKQQLAKVLKIMNDKPKVKFIICAQATALDAIPKEDETAEPKPDHKLDHKPLLELANQRQKVVMDFLINNESISSERLIGCNVKLSKNLNAPAIVDISI